jgi:phage tail-like protein
MVKSPEFLTAANFYIGLKLDGSSEPVDAIFLECQGITHAQDVIEFCEVTPKRWAKASKGQVIRTKLPGNFRSGNITLRRGMTKSNTFWNWFELVQEGNWAKQRKNASMTIYGESRPQAQFEFTGAWPTSYKVSDVKSNSQEIEIEEVEIAFEGFKRAKL